MSNRSPLPPPPPPHSVSLADAALRPQSEADCSDSNSNLSNHSIEPASHPQPQLPPIPHCGSLSHPMVLGPYLPCAADADVLSVEEATTSISQPSLSRKSSLSTISSLSHSLGSSLGIDTAAIVPWLLPLLFAFQLWCFADSVWFTALTFEAHEFGVIYIRGNEISAVGTPIFNVIFAALVALWLALATWCWYAACSTKPAYVPPPSLVVVDPLLVAAKLQQHQSPSSHSAAEKQDEDGCKTLNTKELQRGLSYCKLCQLYRPWNAHHCR